MERLDVQRIARLQPAGHECLIEANFGLYSGKSVVAHWGTAMLLAQMSDTQIDAEGVLVAARWGTGSRRPRHLLPLACLEEYSKMYLTSPLRSPNRESRTVRIRHWR